jgi:hypothetical protein
MSDYVTWTALSLAWLALFTFFEARAFLEPNDPNRVTLSRYMATIGAKFPLSLFMIGLVVGGLAVHFWWRWCPAGLPTSGG